MLGGRSQVSNQWLHYQTLLVLNCIYHRICTLGCFGNIILLIATVFSLAADVKSSISAQAAALHALFHRSYFGFAVQESLQIERERRKCCKWAYQISLASGCHLPLIVCSKHSRT
jgi:hypothetical protein